MREYLTRKIYGGVVFALAIFGTTILAVAISGTIKTWTTGEVLKSADLNTTIASLQTAIQNIPNWTKAANGTDAYFTDGKVGIGTASPGNKLDIAGALNVQSGCGFFAANTGFMDYCNGVTRIQSGNIVSPSNLLLNGYGGNVGIGTVSPGVALDIQSGNLRLYNSNVQATSSIEFKRTTDNWTRATIEVTQDSAYMGAIAFKQNTTNIVGDNPSTTMTLYRGNVGIGITTPANRLDVVDTSQNITMRLQGLNGTCTHAPQAGTETVACSSDEKLKKNIRDAAPVLDELTKLQIREYSHKQTGKSLTGVIAQEVQKVNPELVHSDETGSLMVEQINPWKIVKAIQELSLRLRSVIELQQAEKEANEKKLLALEEDNKRLRDTVETLRATSLRTSQQLEDRLRAIENTQMARK